MICNGLIFLEASSCQRYAKRNLSAIGRPCAIRLIFVSLSSPSSLHSTLRRHTLGSIDSTASASTWALGNASIGAGCRLVDRCGFSCSFGHSLERRSAHFPSTLGCETRSPDHQNTSFFFITCCYRRKLAILSPTNTRRQIFYV